MADDAFDSWLRDFRQEVDASLKGSAPPSLGAPEARQAQAAFDQWWDAEQRPVTETSVRCEVGTLDEPLRPTRKAEAERYVADEWPVRLEKLADERARLLLRAEKAEEENRVLKERLSAIQTELASQETRISRSRQGFEEHIARLEAGAAQAAAQIKDLRESREALDAALKRAQDDQAASRDQLDLERRRADQADKNLLETRRILAEKELKLVAALQDLSAQAGALEELRRQSGVFSQRLVQSKEATDTDLMSMRQELKVFLEELRLLRNSIRKGE